MGDFVINEDIIARVKELRTMLYGSIDAIEHETDNLLCAANGTENLLGKPLPKLSRGLEVIREEAQAADEQVQILLDKIYEFEDFYRALTEYDLLGER